MATRLVGPRLKLRRAKEHCDSLNKSIDRFLKAENYGVRSQFDPKMNAYIVKAVVGKPFPPQWSSIIGDFAHNARSALDQTVSHFDLANGGNAHDTGFPIYLDPNDFRKLGLPMLGSLASSQAFIAEVVAEQPYTRRKRKPATDVLAILADLNNTDKHRTIQTFCGASVLQRADLLSATDRKAIGRIQTYVVATRMEDQKPLAIVTVEFLRKATIELEFEGSFEVAFDEGSNRARNLGVANTLKTIYDRVASIVTNFENKF